MLLALFYIPVLNLTKVIFFTKALMSESLYSSYIPNISPYLSAVCKWCMCVCPCAIIEQVNELF